MDEVISLIFRRCDFPVIALIASAVDGYRERGVIRVAIIVGDAILKHVIGCLARGQNVGGILVGHIIVAAVLINRERSICSSNLTIWIVRVCCQI